MASYTFQLFTLNATNQWKVKIVTLYVLYYIEWKGNQNFNWVVLVDLILLHLQSLKSKTNLTFVYVDFWHLQIRWILNFWQLFFFSRFWQVDFLWWFHGYWPPFLFSRTPEAPKTITSKALFSKKLIWFHIFWFIESQN